MIEHLRHADVDKHWWDSLLLRCEVPMWYAQSWVLDIASPGWEAMVDRASGAIMPLTWRRRMGIHYLYQPFGLQQLGVFAPHYSDQLGEAMLRAIPARFRYWDIYLNERMGPMEFGDPMPCTQQYVDVLGDPAGQQAAYSQGHRRNLRKGEVHRELLTWAISAADFTELFRRTTGARYAVPAADIAMMGHLVSAALERGEARILGTRVGGRVVAAACFVEWQGRSIFLKSAVDESGQEHQAMFLIMDHYLTNGAGRSTVLDLAGSNTPSVARFNAGFGARSTVYLRLKRNELPLPLRWIKK